MIQKRIEEHIQVTKALLVDKTIEQVINKSANLIVHALKSDKAIYFCGNGGSAADSMHLAAELSGKYYFNRKALNAQSLCSDMVAITAISNDFGYQYCFSRQLESKAHRGDILIALSTSGRSANIIEALKTAKKIEMTSILFSGEVETEAHKLSTHHIKIHSQDTPRIQESHLLLGHIICEMIEKEFLD